MKNGTHAAEIIGRIRLLFKKGTPQRGLVNVNEVIQELIVLLRSEITRYSISVRTELAADLPQVMGDRVQLQQVMMNLIMNSIDAMKDVDGTRELAIKSQRTENGELIGLCQRFRRGAAAAAGGPRSSMPSLPRSFTGSAWDCPSAAPSLNRITAACGPPTTLRAARVFTSFCPPGVATLH